MAVHPAGNCMLKVNNRNNRKWCEICSKLTIKTPDLFTRFIVNFEHISHLFLMFLLLTLSRQMSAGSVVENISQEIGNWFLESGPRKLEVDLKTSQNGHFVDLTLEGLREFQKP